MFLADVVKSFVNLIFFSLHCPFLNLVTPTHMMGSLRGWDGSGSGYSTVHPEWKGWIRATHLGWAPQLPLE